jgi:hypothetical protein
MDKMVKVGKFIIGGFVALIVIGLFMPSSETAAKAQVEKTNSVETAKANVDNSFNEDKFFNYMLKFEQPNSNFNNVKNDMLDGAYKYCKDLDNGKASYVKSDPYFLLGSLEISPRWTARTTGAVMYLCPKHLDGLDAFLDTITEKSIKSYLVDSYPNDEMYTNEDREWYFDIIVKNLAYIGGIK